MTPEERETIQRLVQIVMVMLADQGQAKPQIILFEAATKADLLGQELFSHITELFGDTDLPPLSLLMSVPSARSLLLPRTTAVTC